MSAGSGASTTPDRWVVFQGETEKHYPDDEALQAAFGDTRLGRDVHAAIALARQAPPVTRATRRL